MGMSIPRRFHYKNGNVTPNAECKWEAVKKHVDVNVFYFRGKILMNSFYCCRLALGQFHVISGIYRHLVIILTIFVVFLIMSSFLWNCPMFFSVALFASTFTLLVCCTLLRMRKNKNRNRLTAHWESERNGIETHTLEW